MNTPTLLCHSRDELWEGVDDTGRRRSREAKNRRQCFRRLLHWHSSDELQCLLSGFYRLQNRSDTGIAKLTRLTLPDEFFIRV